MTTSAIPRRELQILADHCAATADAMAYTLIRTAHSAFIRETEDFSCTILTAKGMAVASPRSFGAPWYSGIDYAPVIDMIDQYEDGDVCITNDPYSGYVCTHSPDMHIWQPIFHQGRIVCILAGHIHNTDIGGAVPASLSRSLTDIAQEGIRLPPVKLVSRGVVDEQLLAILRTNVRAPEQNYGDIQAQLASMAVGARRIRQVIERFGVDRFVSGLDQLLDYAEEQARAEIAKIPDGEYFFADFADEDGEGGPPCRVALTLTVKGRDLVFDYTGTDPQAASSLNMPTGGHERHPIALVGLTYVLATLRPSITQNAGTLRAARAILPPGSVVNCEAPAAVGMRSLTCMLTQIVTFGAFAQALPERIPATAPGGNAIMNIRTAGWDGRPIMASIGPVGGGGGGAASADGSSGAGGATAFLKNTPIEISESEVRILFRRYGLWPDTGGPGRHRGGLSAAMEIEVSTPGTIVTARNRNRSVFSSWGIAGGRSGTLSRMDKISQRTGTEQLGNADFVKADPGDVILVVGPGAGGFGHPFDRPASAVLHDVKCGFVSEAAAARDYGVAIVDGTVDEAESARLRSDRPVQDAMFDYGTARAAFETVWSRDRYDVITRLLSEAPVGWRSHLKARILAELADPDLDIDAFAANAQALIAKALGPSHYATGVAA